MLGACRVLLMHHLLLLIQLLLIDAYSDRAHLCQLHLRVAIWVSHNALMLAAYLLDNLLSQLVVLSGTYVSASHHRLLIQGHETSTIAHMSTGGTRILVSQGLRLLIAIQVSCCSGRHSLPMWWCDCRRPLSSWHDSPTSHIPGDIGTAIGLHIRFSAWISLESGFVNRVIAACSVEIVGCEVPSSFFDVKGFIKVNVTVAHECWATAELLGSSFSCQRSSIGLHCCESFQVSLLLFSHDTQRHDWAVLIIVLRCFMFLLNPHAMPSVTICGCQIFVGNPIDDLFKLSRVCIRDMWLFMMLIQDTLPLL